MSAPTTTDPEHPLTVAFSTELPAGTLLHAGRYRIDRVLGRGGFGITYATDDRLLRRRVAVKELFPDPVARDGRRVLPPAHATEAFAAARDRFLREAAVLARFTHPGIVRVFEVFEEHGTAYLVMELLDGRTLAHVLDERGGPLREAEALDVAARCGPALAVVHAAGVLHRDLNPTNVMVTGSGRVVLIDFGLAQTYTAEHTGVMTRMVTPGYAPPEQYLGEARFGPPTDVYGLAATLYRLLAGRAPVSALDRQAGVALPSPRHFNPAVSRLVADAVLDGLELRAEHRPPTMAALLARLGIAPEPARGTAPATDAARTEGDGPAATAAYLPPPSGAFVRPSPPAPPAAPSPVPSPAPGARAVNRWKLAVPALAAVAAVGSATPVLAAAFLTLIGLPSLATVGDVMAYVRGRRREAGLGWRHRVALPPLIPLRLARNVGAVLYTSVPALLLMASVVAVALLLDAADAGPAVEELVVRPGGVAVALLLVVPVLRRRDRLRVAVVADEAVARGLDDHGRLTRAGLGLWAAAVLIGVLGFGLRPDLWPLT